LRENSEIIIETNEFVLMQNHTKPMKQIDKILQHSSQVFDVPITCCVEDLVSSKVQPLVEDKAEKEHVHNPKILKNVPMTIVKKLEKV
jgi:Asp-tRNA(Asn)/Glu-tRNA(Gln) amidotransferase C subunit